MARKKTTTTTTVVEEIEDTSRGNAPRKTVVTFLLDQTGSMENIKDDTMGAFNAYLDRLQRDLGDLVEFNFLLFNSNAIETRYTRAKLSDVGRLTIENYRPNNFTPLIDACVTAIKTTEEAVGARTDNPNVIVVFQTDGAENTSKKYNRRDLAAMIQAKTGRGWQFVYMGANIDAYQDANSFGIAVGQTVSYVGANSQSVMDSTARNTASFAMGLTGSMAYTERQKSAAGDAFDKQAQQIAELGKVRRKQPAT